MINDGINDVPDKTISIFISPEKPNILLTKERVSNLVKKPPKKREWFNSHFYRCLPLTIGNQYGFIITSEFDFGFRWNGGQNPEDLKIFIGEHIDENLSPNITSHFGSGIITINTPFFLRTAPGVNLMTINPPNYFIPNITVMTGVVEADNLRRNFTFNLKVQIPEIQVDIPAGTPLAGFIPVPRYYCDDFKLEFADDIFSRDIIEEELKADIDSGTYRKNIEPTLKNGVGQHHLKGIDIYGNKFKDHQKP